MCKGNTPCSPRRFMGGDPIQVISPSAHKPVIQRRIRKRMLPENTLSQGKKWVKKWVSPPPFSGANKYRILDIYWQTRRHRQKSSGCHCEEVRRSPRGVIARRYDEVLGVSLRGGTTKQSLLFKDVICNCLELECIGFVNLLKVSNIDFCRWRHLCVGGVIFVIVYVAQIQ